MPAIKIIMFVLPLGLDSFAVAAAIGAAGTLTARDRWRTSGLFVVLEAGMPVIGLMLGVPLAQLIAGTAQYLAAAAVIAVGAWTLLHSNREEEDKARRVTSAHSAALIGLGVGISMDELAIGFSLGLTDLPLVPVIIGIAAQAFAAAQLGLHLGKRIAGRYREAAERLAGVMLTALGLYLAIERLLA